MTVAVKLVWLVIFIGGGEILSVCSFQAPETSRIHYVASLENDGGQFCSGCVLGTRWILTLASCVRHVSPVDISVGIQPQDSSSSGHHEKVQNIYVHPSGKTKKEGLAILKLKRSMNWVNRTLPIAVMDNYHDLTSVSQCIMLGWNRNREDSILAENVQLNCTNSTKGTFCVHDHRAKFCEFHRGSPLICKTGEIFQTVALLSNTSQCLDQNVTEMFTPAVEYSTWITSIVTENWSMLQTDQNHSWRLSKFNWLTLAILFFIASVIIFIKVLRSGFKI